MKSWDLFSAPLTGMNLIEASAGTGKTYTLTGLYLRLVLEKALPVESILVVTYTNAATAELRSRIRTSLLAARSVFEGVSSQDTLLLELRQSHADSEQAILLLTKAILDFDRAAVYTIHGFCQRVLTDSAFESGLPFTMELAPEQLSRLQRIVDDEWALNNQNISAGFAAYLYDNGLTPDRLLSDIKNYINKPYLALQAWTPPEDVDSLEQCYKTTFDETSAVWTSDAEEVKSLLRESSSLNGNTYRKKSLEVWFSLMDGYLTSSVGVWFDKFEKFSLESIKKGTKKDKVAPEHRFFVHCAKLLAAQLAVQTAYIQGVSAFRAKLIHQVNQALTKTKKQERIRSYDDLLIDLQTVLTGESASNFASLLRKRYQAALVDEFQDTDPIQYDIFSRIYFGQAEPVYLVGDPKQAIYSFRGADVFTYLRAHSAAESCYTLDQNWRSVPELINAVNHIFTAVEQPFIDQRISYQPVKAGDKDHKPLLDKSQNHPPLPVWFLQGDDQKPITQGLAKEIAAKATAAEISRLLNAGQAGHAFIGDDPLRGGDIAVLVRSHSQGRFMQQMLHENGVNSVIYSQESVFESAEAEALERVLLGILQPNHVERIRAALSTIVFGYDGADIFHLDADDSILESQLDAFLEYHRLWQTKGFASMFAHVVEASDLSNRLLSLQNGERQLTNLLHLGELLQQEDSFRRPGMDGLTKWLSQQRQANQRDNEASQLRLESDQHLVQIVTVHKSKGLEYPVVFCPFLWTGGSNRLRSDPTFMFHDPDQDDLAVADLGCDSSETNRQYAQREALAEELRLLYVAITRASYRCYLTWGNIKGAENSALGWLLHPLASTESRTSALKKEFATQAKQLLLDKIESLEQMSKGAIGLVDLPAEAVRFKPKSTDAQSLLERTFSGSIDYTHHVASFSGLVSQSSRLVADRDEGDRDILPAPISTEKNIYTFPRGPRPGSCLHHIFESLDFSSCTADDIQQAATDSLTYYGIDVSWEAVISHMVRQVLDTPLDRSETVYLRDVQLSTRLVELEFFYSLNQLNCSRLVELLKQHNFGGKGPITEAIKKLGFSQVKGYLHGFIDLVFESNGRFYLLDYKSNWLGDNREKYAADQLPHAIAHHHYYLQYLLYSLALHRYLKQRLPDYQYATHFGGAYYCFVRGMSAENGMGYGVYRDRPDEALIDALDAHISLRELSS